MTHLSDNFHTTLGANRMSSFSSYPGVLSSTDDFFIIGDGNVGSMVMLETTNTGMIDYQYFLDNSISLLTVYNQTLYQYITPNAALVLLSLIPSDITLPYRLGIVFAYQMLSLTTAATGESFSATTTRVDATSLKHDLSLMMMM